ncbi:MAG: LuxR C-terminal-related transcriptional regulator [Solirubrobacteraceae bacterium]
MSEKTVRNHLSSLYRKLDVTGNRTQVRSALPSAGAAAAAAMLQIRAWNCC